jgi:redox-sensitive bicupin YhaK (pirin superfamily)
LYHIHIEAGKSFTVNFKDKIEVAAFLPTENAILNDTAFHKGDFIAYDRSAGEIEIKNNSEKVIDIMLFGGESYTESIIAEGPFIMNTQAEIAEAYRDFYAGKYGEIKINNKI